MNQETSIGARLTALRQSLEKDLTEAIEARIEAFRAETGLQVSRIDVPFESIRTIGDAHPRYVMGPIDVEIRV